MQAPATLKERVVWLVFMGLLFFLLYGAANEFAHLSAPHSSIFWDWETQIPFIPAFIVPYMSSDVVFVIAFLLAQTRFELRVLALRVLFIVLLSVSIFVFFPLQFAFEKPPIESFGFLFKLLEADKPFNQLPSLHVSFSIVFWCSMKSHLSNKWVRWFLAVWLSLVTLSTLFVFQHHVIDIPTGLMVGLLAVYLFRKGRNEVLFNKFTTPRHLKMGLYFLTACIVLMMLSFTVYSLSIPFFSVLLTYLLLYVFVSLLCVSLIYAFGFNHLLVNQQGNANSLQKIIFFPYFFGCKISWHYYKRSLSLCAHVDQGLFVGRHPSHVEYVTVRGLGVKHVINLACELQLNKSSFIFNEKQPTKIVTSPLSSNSLIANDHLTAGKLIQHRLNFLDQTIQSPAALHQAVLLVERYKAEGVYVHCALGLSRSILVIWAWMIFKGKTDQAIIKHLTQIRPRFIQSRYMLINIGLYRGYLKKV